MPTTIDPNTVANILDLVLPNEDCMMNNGVLTNEDGMIKNVFKCLY